VEDVELLLPEGFRQGHLEIGAGPRSRRLACRDEPLQTFRNFSLW